MTPFGIDRLLAEPELRRPLEGKRVALLAHPASVTRDLTHSLDALASVGLNLTAAFGPQHGLRGDKQDNMVESDAAPGFGWPHERIWINPSPNAANLNMARAYAGTVMLEGTTLSEGRGTTRPLEQFGAPDLEPLKIMAEMEARAPEWLAGCKLREVTFHPTFH